jgi:ribosome-associated toxin RatA of RatAB toxin-antitoxin module
MSSSFEGSEIFAASPERILSLINNFESYKEFLPGCLESSKLPDEEEGFVSGRLVFSLLNQTYAFESNNKTAGHEVSITQSKGPFLDFYALWILEVIDENLTKVTFETKFSLPFILQVIATQSLIDKIGSKFIHAFATQLLK